MTFSIQYKIIHANKKINYPTKNNYCDIIKVKA